MRFELPALPFDRDALEPHISADTVHYHYDKHHRGYLDKLEKALEGDETHREKSLEDIVRAAHRQENAAVFNPAAQVYNHNLYWRSLNPHDPVEPGEELAGALSQDFGSIDAFKAEFRDKAINQFGSGWAWLVFDSSAGRLRVIGTSDAMTPLVAGLEPLLTLDVWEHAYYLDYQNSRADYVDCFLDELINWEVAEQRYMAVPAAA